MTLTALPPGMQQFCDANGVPLIAGTVYHFYPGTEDPKDTWADDLGTVRNENPLTLDGAGRAVIFGVGRYRQRVLDVLGNLIWDKVTTVSDIANSLATVANLQAYTGEATIALVAYHTLPGDGGGGAFLRNGEDAPVTRVVTLTSGSKIAAIVSGGSAALLRPGMAVEGSGVVAGTRYALMGEGTNSILLQDEATDSITTTLTFSLDNNGTILIDALGRRWDRIVDMTGYAEAAWFGTKNGDPDYSDQNLLAIQSAMSWLDDQGGGRTNPGSNAVTYIQPRADALTPQLVDVSGFANPYEIAGNGPATIIKLNPQYWADNPDYNGDAHIFTHVGGTGDVIMRDLQLDGSAYEITQLLTTTLSIGAAAGDTVINVVDTSIFAPNMRYRFQGNGSTVSIRTVQSVNAGAGTITLTQTLGITANAGNIVHRYLNEQMHGFRVDCRSGTGFSRDGGALANFKVHNVWFTNIRGDGVFGIGQDYDGSTHRLLTNLELVSCVHIGPYDAAVFNTQTAGRSGAAFQRNCEHIRVAYGYGYGITDAFVDAEATGQGPNLAMDHFEAIYNHVVHTNEGPAISPGGLDRESPSENIVVSFNALYGGGIRFNDTRYAKAIGNFVYGDTTEPPIYSINCSDDMLYALNTVIDNRTVNQGDGALQVRGLQLSRTVTISNASPGVVNYTVPLPNPTSQIFENGDPITFTTTGALPNPLAINTIYYVRDVNHTNNTFSVAATLGGAAINTTTAGSGVHTARVTQMTHRTRIVNNYARVGLSGNAAISVANVGDHTHIIGNLGSSAVTNTQHGILVSAVTPGVGTRTGGLICFNAMEDFVDAIALSTYDSDFVQLSCYSLIGNQALGSSALLRLDCGAGTAVPFPNLCVSLNNGDSINIAVAAAINDQTGGRQTHYLVGGNQLGPSSRYVGNGNPNTLGVVAPIGAKYTNRTGTLATGIEWIKTTATGGTGWRPVDGYTATVAGVNPPNLAAGAIGATATTTAITAAAVGDKVIVSHTTIGVTASTVGYLYFGQVDAAGSIVYWPENHSAGALDPGSGTLTLTVIPQ